MDAESCRGWRNRATRRRRHRERALLAHATFDGTVVEGENRALRHEWLRQIPVVRGLVRLGFAFVPLASARCRGPSIAPFWVPRSRSAWDSHSRLRQCR